MGPWWKEAFSLGLGSRALCVSYGCEEGTYALGFGYEGLGSVI